MRRLLTSHRVLLAMAAVVVALKAGPPAVAQTISNWTRNGGNWTYCNGHNWSTDPLVPLNDGADVFEVVINPTTATMISYDCVDAGFVNGLELWDNATLMLNAGRSYSANGPTVIRGTLQVAASDFYAGPEDAPVVMQNGRVAVSGGGLVRLLATSYSASSLNGTYDLFVVSGTDAVSGEPSVLDLSSLEVIDDGFSYDGFNFQSHRIWAHSGGVIDLSGVDTIWAPRDGSADDELKIVAESGATIDLSSLQTVTSAGGGFVRFQFQNAATNLPVLASVMNTIFETSFSPLSLPALGTVRNTRFSPVAGSIVNLPMLANVDGTTFTVSPGTTYNMNIVQELRDSTIAFQGNGTVNAPALKRLEASQVEVGAGRTIFTGGLEGFDNSRLSVTGGRVFGVASGDVIATEYSASALNGSYDLFVVSGVDDASGQPSTLDLSLLEVLDDGFSYDGFNFHSHRIWAHSGGVIDLSRVDTIWAPRDGSADDELRIVAESGATIDLSSLRTVTTAGGGFVRFQFQNAAMNLPLLASATNTIFETSFSPLSLPVLGTVRNTRFSPVAGSIVDLPVLANVDGTTFTVSAGTTYNMNIVPELRDSTIVFQGNGTVNAPGLKRLEASQVEVGAGRTIITGGLEGFDNSRLSVTGGKVFGVASGDVSATEYSASSLLGTYDLFVVSGVDDVSGQPSTLDLSLLEVLDDGFNFDGFNSQSHRIWAHSGGVIDLRNVDTIWAPREGHDELKIVAESGAIDLSSLRMVTSTGAGFVRFTVNDGSLRLGTLSGITNMSLTGTGSGARVDVVQSLLLGSNTLSFTGGAVLTVGGDYLFSSSNENTMISRTGILKLEGTESQWLEVGGVNRGIDDIDENSSPNFGWGQLVVGQPGRRTTVELVDLESNSSPSGDREALYLFGLGGPTGLRILGGSTLIVGNINVYARIEDAWVHINSLFDGGSEFIEFDEGFITRFGMVDLGDCDFDGKVALEDIESFGDCFSGPGVDPDPPGCWCEDIDNDGDADLADFAILQRTFTGD